MFTSDNVFQRMTLAMNAKAKAPQVPSLFEGSVTGRSSEPVDAKATVKFQMKKINAVAVVAPEKFTPLQDVIDGFTGRVDGQSNQLSNARDAQRRLDANTIVTACYQYAIDHNGEFPASFTATPTEICASGKTCNGVSIDLLMSSYLVSIPRDPALTEASRISGYTIQQENDRISVSAPLAEGDNAIQVTR
jgi:hypothetical protein